MPPTISRRLALGGLAATAALPALATRANGEVSVGPGKLTVEGRYAFAPSGALRLGYPGIALRMAATTPQLTMRVDSSSPDVFLAIRADGGAPRTVRLAKGQQDLVVFDGVPGRHEIEIVRRTESWQGTMEVLGFGQAGDGYISALPSPERRLMFIGDSITCGAGLDAAPDSKADGPETSDASRAFGRLLAERLKAACHLVSYGGKGIIRDWQGKTTELTAPQFYTRAMPDDPTTTWDPHRYVPQAVAICLGTNDFNQGIPDREAFVGTYASFVRRILRDAPGTRVLLLDSPMTDDGADKRRTALLDYLDDTVHRVGSPDVTHAHVAHQPGRPSNAHPIASQHVAMADEIEPQLRAATGWR